MSTLSALRALSNGEIVGIIDGKATDSPDSGADTVTNSGVEDDECVDTAVGIERPFSLG